MTTTSAWAGPRERAAEGGVESLGDAELLAILLGTGYAGVPVGTLAATLLEDNGGVAGLARAGLGHLAQQAGVGPAKGARLAAAVELGRRAVFAASLDASPRMPDQAAVEGWARARLATLDHEELWVLALDGRHGLRAARRVASGGIHGLHVGARDVLRVALREAASAFVLVHNHPSGDPAPSDVPWRRTITPGPVMLFRYSAITFNPRFSNTGRHSDSGMNGPCTKSFKCSASLGSPSLP